MNGLSGFALAGYLNDLEREKKKAYGAVDTLNRESAASDQYQGARNRTNDWLSSLSPEDLAKLNPEVRNLSSNFEGVGDVGNFDSTKRATDLGLTSQYKGVEGIEDYLKSLDEIKKTNKQNEVTTALERATKTMGEQRGKQEEYDSYKAIEELGNAGKLDGYKPGNPVQKPLSNREIFQKSGLNKYDDPRIKDFYDMNVKDPEDMEAKRLNDPYKNAQIENMKTRAKYLEYQMENANPEKRAEIQAELMKLKENLGRETDLINYNRDPKPTYGDLLKEQEAKVKDFSEDSTVSDALSFIRDIRSDSNGAFGLDPRRLFEAVDGTGEFVFKQKVDQLKNLLTLAERGKLKGQGQVSDMETEMLRKASTLLSTKLPAKAFKAELDRIEQYLNKQGQKPSLKPDATKPNVVQPKPASTTEPPATSAVDKLKAAAKSGNSKAQAYLKSKGVSW